MSVIFTNKELVMNLMIGNVYNLRLRGGVILGEEVRSVKLVEKTSYERALKYMNIPAMHQALYKFLPEGTPNNPKKYEYLVFKTQSGNDLCYAEPWLIKDEVEEVIGKVFKVEFANISDSEMMRVVEALNYMNIPFTSSVEDLVA